MIIRCLEPDGCNIGDKASFHTSIPRGHESRNMLRAGMIKVTNIFLSHYNNLPPPLVYMVHFRIFSAYFWGEA